MFPDSPVSVQVLLADDRLSKLLRLEDDWLSELLKFVGEVVLSRELLEVWVWKLLESVGFTGGWKTFTENLVTEGHKLFFYCRFLKSYRQLLIKITEGHEFTAAHRYKILILFNINHYIILEAFKLERLEEKD